MKTKEFQRNEQLTWYEEHTKHRMIKDVAQNKDCFILNISAKH